MNLGQRMGTDDLRKLIALLKTNNGCKCELRTEVGLAYFNGIHFELMNGQPYQGRSK